MWGRSATVSLLLADPRVEVNARSKASEEGSIEYEMAIIAGERKVYDWGKGDTESTVLS